MWNSCGNIQVAVSRIGRRHCFVLAHVLLFLLLNFSLWWEERLCFRGKIGDFTRRTNTDKASDVCESPQLRASHFFVFHAGAGLKPRLRVRKRESPVKLLFRPATNWLWVLALLRNRRTNKKIKTCLCKLYRVHYLLPTALAFRAESLCFTSLRNDGIFSFLLPTVNPLSLFFFGRKNQT